MQFFMGCGAAINAPRGGHFGAAIGPIWFQYIYCNGTESLIMECNYPTLKDRHPEGLSHEKDAGAVCSRKFCQGWEGVLSRTTSGFIPRLSMRTWITPFRMYLGKYSTHTVIS